MSQYDYDLFTIGAGSGGVRASRFAANFGARVAIAEAKHLGGTCVNVGCVPKKLFVYASQFATTFTDAPNFGWQKTPTSFDWATLLENTHAEINRLNGIYQTLLTNAGVKLIHGRAKLIDPHTIEIEGQHHTAANILIATGGQPRRLQIPGAQHALISDDIFHLPKLPQRLLILGSGYIGVEFAGIMHGLGVQTHLVQRGTHILNHFDHDIRQHLQNEYTKKGIHIHTNTSLARIDKQPHNLQATLTNGTKLLVDEVLLAIGRTPNTQNLGLEKIGVKQDPHGAILVNDQFQTNIPHIYALGDVINRANLTPVATAQGMALARTLFDGQPSQPIDYQAIPTAVFSQPEVGTIGLTEQQARQKHPHILIYRTQFRPMKMTISGRDQRTMMKLIVNSDNDRVLGLHIVGPDAGEITQGFAVAMKAGATKTIFDQTIGIHPTAAEELVTLRTPIQKEA